MAGPDLPSTSIQSIDLTLNRLINFRKNLNSKLVMHPVNGSNVNGMGDPATGIQGIDTNMVKTILEENPEMKKERDSARFFQVAIIKMLDKIIEEQVQKFFTNKQLEKEIMLLEGRLKDSQKTEEDKQKVQMDLTRLNSLESLERAKMLMMLNTLQTLNDRYLYLEVEQKKSFEKFSQSMLKTLDGVKKDDGVGLTALEKTSLNKELAQAEIRLAEQFMEKQNNKLEGRRFNEILTSIEPRTNSDFSNFKKDTIDGLFVPTYKQEKNSDDLFEKVTSSAEFKAAHLEQIKEILSKNNIRDPAQVKTVADKRLDSIKSEPAMKKIIEVSKEQKIVAAQKNELLQNLKNNKAIGVSSVMTNNIDKDVEAARMARRARNQL